MLKRAAGRGEILGWEKNFKGISRGKNYRSPRKSDCRSRKEKDKMEFQKLKKEFQKGGWEFGQWHQRNQVRPEKWALELTLWQLLVSFVEAALLKLWELLNIMSDPVTR